VSRRGPRVGLWGLLGSGNIGNDISMQSVLCYIRARHPDAVIDAMCMGPDRVRADAGIGAIPLLWYQQFDERVSGLPAKVLKAVGKVIDAGRTAAWVRRHDVVIVPGMGVLEASTPINWWGVPYALFLVSACGKLFRAKVAMVSVGATVINQPAVRWFSTWAGRLAYYRSYRDDRSREAMRQRGLDVGKDRVFPDLVFAIPPASSVPGDPKTIGVGIMTYYGTNDDRSRADALHAAYTQTMTRFIQWLLDDERDVRLFTGDKGDAAGVAEITAALRRSHPQLAPGRLIADQSTTFAELMAAMAPVSCVVATRYHNVMCALKLSKPTISISYSTKNISLMEEMGLPEFWQNADDIDYDRLIEQFTKLEANAAQLRETITEHNAQLAAKLNDQFSVLDEVLFG